MKWAILGSSGMLGSEFTTQLIEEDCAGFTKNNLDITNYNQVRQLLRGFDVVVNCAAWTNVDAAEEFPESAYAVNEQGVRNVALVCQEQGSRLIQFSTDYVFSGQSNVPYEVDDKPEPQSVYGLSKLAGENVVREILPNSHLIIRTAWLYGHYGSNFVKTILKLEKIQDDLKVVNDQIGQPTWVHDVVKKVIEINDVQVDASTFHVTNSGQASWYEFAQEIFKNANKNVDRVKPVSSREFPRAVNRPKYSVLGHRALASHGMSPMQDWREALKQAFISGEF